MALYNDKLTIVGGQIPRGDVIVSGAKNSATRLLAASSICDTPVKLTGYPTNLVDSKHKQRFLQANGAKVECSEDSILADYSNYLSVDLDDYFFPIRTTYLLVAGQLKKSGIARIPYPGGCNIGARKYDMHIMVWESFGCVVTEKENHIEVRAPDVILATNIAFPISTVGGTENALLCASIAEGTSIITNAYITPEIEDLIAFLNQCGVGVSVIGGSEIHVKGSPYISGGEYKVMADRIEAITWIVYAALSGGSITVHNVPFDSMTIPLMHLKNCGLDFYQNTDSIHVSRNCFKNGIHSFEVACGTHPGIISDMQPFFVMLALVAKGISRVHDFRYPERVTYVKELNKLLENEVAYENGLITITGDNKFISGEANSSDLRGTMAAVIAGLCAKEGTTTINGVSMALRGYNDLPQKLKTLGVEVTYSDSE
ncbi:UDP-N-acetylglucosamine 1-carboxyvinyltransferase [Vibrio alginolyticus]